MARGLVRQPARSAGSWTCPEGCGGLGRRTDCPVPVWRRVPCSLGVFCCFFVHSSGLPQQGQAVFLPVWQQGWPQSGRVDLHQVRCGYILSGAVVASLQAWVKPPHWLPCFAAMAGRCCFIDLCLC